MPIRKPGKCFKRPLYPTRRSGDRTTGHSKTARHRLQFTLIELLVVISILALLAGLILAAVRSAVEQSRKTHCSNNLRQVGLLLIQYADDYDGRFPIAYRIAETPAEPYCIPNLVETDTRDVFKCPSDVKNIFDGKTFAEKHATSYEWEPWFNGRKIENVRLELAGEHYLAPLMLDAESFHGKKGRNYLYADGRVTGKMESPTE